MRSGVYDSEMQQDPYASEYLDLLGKTVAGDPSAATAMEQLARDGSVLAILHVANAMRSGTTYAVDLTTAEKWYRSASKYGSNRAFYGLALTYYATSRFDDVVAALKRPVAATFPPAMNVLGQMYYHGLGTSHDTEAALQLWRRGVELEHPRSRRSLARVFTSGAHGWRHVPEGVRHMFDYAHEVMKLRAENPQTDQLW
ncbi:MAG: sel1 repeat family protein [Alphaproteobacteria bacterium]|nr:MAG: sel1 repeat family protein [Alphaproteobacteria bacterium]